MVCSHTLVGSKRLKPTLQEAKRSLKDKIAAIDIGNSSICLALFEGDELLNSYTTPTQNPEEAAKCLAKLDSENKLSCIAVASVVPEARDAVTAAFDRERVYNVNPQNQSSIKNIYDTLGADRLANCVAARRIYTKTAPAAAILDFGTATTLTAVSQDGTFLGGLITLGLMRTLSALSTSTAQLPKTRISKDLLEAAVLGPAFDTESAILNGTLLAHLGLVQNWLLTVKKELPAGTTTIVTGGLSSILGPLISRDYDVIVDQMLTLKGIKLAAEEATVPADRD